MKTKLALCILIGIASVIRLWHLGNDGHPLLWDEAANGYNAYSILKTGRDEYGELFPAVLKSFGNYGPALPSYVTIPSIFVLGLNEFSVRLPSAFAGVFIILLFFGIGQELFPQTRISFLGLVLTPGLVAAFLAVFSPWLIHFSRGGWEANINLMLTLLGIWSFLRARRTHRFLILSGAAFGLTFLTYQSAKMFTPLILVGLLLTWGKETLRADSKLIIASILLLVLGLFPIVANAPGASGRLAILNVFSYPRPDDVVRSIASQDARGATNIPFWVFHSELYSQVQGVLERYFNHFSARFLFYEGNWNDGRLGSPYVGQFYWPDLLFFALGFLALARNKNSRVSAFLLYWVMISPLPSAFSKDIIHSIRSYNLVVPMLVLGSLGLLEIFSFLQRKGVGVSLVILSGLTLVYSFSVWYYLDSYFVHAPVVSANDWLFGYKEAVLALDDLNPSGKPVYFTQKLGQPYIFILFYNKVSPALYQKQAHLTQSATGDVGSVDHFANYTFEDFYWPKARGNRDSFFVGTEDQLPTKDIDPRQAQILRDILDPDGSIALRIVKTF